MTEKCFCLVHVPKLKLQTKQHLIVTISTDFIKAGFTQIADFSVQMAKDEWFGMGREERPCVFRNLDNECRSCATDNSDSLFPFHKVSSKCVY